MLLTLYALLSPAAAQAGPTGGIALGKYRTFAESPIGPAWWMALRGGVAIVPQFDLEIEGNWGQGLTREHGIVYDLLSLRGSALFHFTPDRRADLFIDAGIGGQSLNIHRDGEGLSPGPDDEALYQNPSSDLLVHAGPGVIVHLAGPVHLRGDLRWLGSFGNNPTESASDTFQNVEWTIGLDFRRELPPDIDGDGYPNKEDGCPNDAEDFDDFEDEDGCPEADNDKDTIVDDDDQCDSEKEDFDGFEDDDGCPERDNDKDGLTDKRDECPNRAEDKDGFEDEDGCPDKDNDGDGIADAKDRCPDHAEDVDGWEDDDGCPDKDNDDDRIADVRDLCPNQPENYNKIDDEDGCPDDAPPPPPLPDIKKFTGVIAGITFETGKANIRASSYPTLTEAARTLIAYPDVRIEIQGHTDAVGSDAKNLSLSQSRADAVRTWLLSAGVPSDRIRAVGYGETRPLADNGTDAGRAENRRVEFRLLNEDGTLR